MKRIQTIDSIPADFGKTLMYSTCHGPRVPDNAASPLPAASSSLEGCTREHTHHSISIASKHRCVVNVQLLQVFDEKPLASLGLDKYKVFIEVNRGRSVRLFSNPHHKAQVRGSGASHVTLCSFRSALICVTQQNTVFLQPETILEVRL